MIARKCNTENFDQFIRKVAENYAGRRVVMFLDGAGLSWFSRNHTFRCRE